jgi:hypothetical protein
VRAAIVKRDAGPHQETISVGRDLDRARSPARAIKPAKVSSHAIVPVTEMLHRRLFRNLRSRAPQLSQFFCTKQSRTGRWHKLVRRDGAMRELLGREIPDTAPYTEWLAIVGSILVAVLVCAVLFSNGVLS